MFVCEDQDIKRVFGECDKNGQREVIHEWFQPVLCNRDHKKSLALPKNGNTEECRHDCPYGMLVRDGTCQFCPPGQYLGQGSDGVDRCQVCEAGFFTPKIHSYSNLEEMPEGFEVTCTETSDDDQSQCQLAQKWRIVDGNLFSGSSVISGVRIGLKFQVEVQSAGNLFVDYQLEGFKKGDPTDTFRIALDGNIVVSHYESTGGAF
jgi:hypothetical protein